jgi:hypothetical protein
MTKYLAGAIALGSLSRIKPTFASTSDLQLCAAMADD